MRNLLLLQDAISAGLDDPEAGLSDLASLCRDLGSTNLLALTAAGILFSLDPSTGFDTPTESWNVNPHGSSSSSSNRSNSSGGGCWFNVAVVTETGAIVCVSHSGLLVSIKEDPETGRWSDVVEQEGDVEGGIAAAAWSPDTNRLALLTNNDTVLLMTGYWDVLEEVPLPAARVPSSLCGFSWRGDGEYLSMITVDADDGLARARVFTKDLELHATGRNVADGPASALKNLDPVVAYATNGSLVALAQQRSRAKLQVVFVERNGLRHGEFDVRCPSPDSESGQWEVQSLHWDMPSTLLAVGLRWRGAAGDDDGNGADNGVATRQPAVQIYYRSNYHWYLKQQWQAPGLRCLGFDTEAVGRLFMAQVPPSFGFQPSAAEAATALRIVDLAWDVCGSGLADGTVAVVDGATLLLTPLALSAVPPPMSMHRHDLPAPCRHAFFWARPPPPADAPGADDAERWGIACLCSDLRVQLVFGDARGAPVRSVDVDLADALASEVIDTVFRGIAAVEDMVGGQPTLAVVLHGAHTLLGHEVIVGVNIDVATWTTKNAYVRMNPNGNRAHAYAHGSGGGGDSGGGSGGERAQVVRVAAWPGRPGCLAMGLRSDHSGSGECTYDVHCVPCAFPTQSEPLSSAPDDISMACPHLTVAFPESCVHIAVLPPPTDAAEPSPRDVVVGQSERGKLYCGESLLVAGVSTFVVNEPLGALMYVTTGTRPTLQFCSVAALATLDPLADEAWEERVAAVAWPFAEPRPVERGARLVAAVPGQPKVVLQMSRGNLEAFEPRPLILLQARMLIDRGDLLQALLVLRRQRVDLNYLVDYRPVAFLAGVDVFVDGALRGTGTHAEVLSLLVSSLDPADTTRTKYPSDSPVRPLPQADFYDADRKVNAVCEALRAALLPRLRGPSPAANAAGAPLAAAGAALNPTLCTYARQRPPLLVEALTLIREVCAAPAPASAHGALDAATANGGGGSLSVAKVQSAIRYLAFLADGTALFNAALGDCDFDMARAVSRQCQMDPKVYLPLLQRFEDVGAGAAVGSVRHARMHFDVAVHLKRWDVAVDWCVQLLRCAVAVADAPATGGGSDSDGDAGHAAVAAAVAVAAETAALVAAHDLHATALPMLVGLVASLPRPPGPGPGPGPGPAARGAAMDLLSRARLSHGAACMKRRQYGEAVVAYLTASPPRPAEAVDAARQDGDWQRALMIAGRYAAPAPGGAGLDPRRVASEIVREYKESLEQAESGLFGAAEEADGGDDDGGGLGLHCSAGASAGAGAGTGASAVAGGMPTGLGTGDKAVDAAQIAVDYCADPESAVTILVLAQRWSAAVQVALKTRRADLLREEIAPAARAAAHAALAALPARSVRQLALVGELQTLWGDHAARLTQVAGTEPALLAELRGAVGGDPSRPDGLGDADDGKSEYTAASRSTALSNLSGATSRSRASASSALSSASSSITVLSNTSLTSGRSSHRTTAFAIEGLDHTLLSRGEARGPGGSDLQGRKEHPRKAKRRERKAARGSDGGRDVWGLRREAAVCRELWGLANVAAAAKGVHDLCDALLLLPDPPSTGAGVGAGSSTISSDGDDALLAARLQRAADDHFAALKASPPPVAPMYPPHWMQKRLLTFVDKFQEYSEASLAATAAAAVAKEEEEAAGDRAMVATEGEDNRAGADADADADAGAVVAQAAEVHAALLARRRGAPASTWWQRAADGILLWQSLRRASLEMPPPSST